MQEKEFYFKPDTIYCGDNLKILKDFPKECADLIYIDPPFFSGRNYDILFKDPTAVKGYGSIKVEKNGHEHIAFKDMFSGKMSEYLTFMVPRIQALWRVLKPTGSFYLHCDWHASAYLKIECDKIFGEGDKEKGRKLFQNEIIWCYNTGGVSKKRWGRKHDTIFFYSKGKTWNFNVKKEKSYTKTLPEPHTKSGKMLGMHRDEDGKFRYVFPRDVWHINSVFRNSPENYGYPTQKPEALLERIVKTSSNENDIVLDAFCGCGTTLAVAKKLRRHFIGIDESPTACAVMSKRINYPKNKIINLKEEIEKIKDIDWHTFQVWTINSLGGKANTRKKEIAEEGIDGWLEAYKNKFNQNIPIEVKKIRTIGKTHIRDFESRIRERGLSGGIFIGLERLASGAIEKIHDLKEKDNIEIIFLSLDDLLSPNLNSILFKKGLQPLSIKKPI